MRSEAFSDTSTLLRINYAVKVNLFIVNVLSENNQMCKLSTARRVMPTAFI